MCTLSNLRPGIRLISLIFSLSLLGSCQKNEPPVCRILQPADGSEFSIGEPVSLVVETEDGDGIVAEVRLFMNGEGVGELLFPFEYDIDTRGMEPGSHRIKVSAWDNDGMETSDEVGITLQAVQSTVTTMEPTGITFNSAVLGGSVLESGGNPVTEAGIYWDTIPEAQKEGARIVMAADTGAFSDTVRNLPEGTDIYYRAFALNGVGESLGGERQFTTPADLVEPSIPTVSTLQEVDSLTPVSAILRGQVIDDGGAEIEGKGFYWGLEPSPEVNGNRVGVTGEFRRTFSGLVPNTTYYFKAFAENSAGEGTGNEESFTTPGDLETTTGDVVNLFFKKAIVSAEVVIVHNSIVTERGVFWGDSPDPERDGTKITAGSGEGNYTVVLDGLTPGETYYYRAYGESGSGVYLGQARTVATVPADTGHMVDPRDDQWYRTVTIGDQVWMGENLRATSLNDGTHIPEMADSAFWFENTIPGFLWYENDESTYGAYGALYNWYAVESGKLCPAGWHVSTDADWQKLEVYLGMDSALVDGTGGRGAEVGGLMMSDELWEPPLSGATNETRMSIFPTGFGEPGDNFFEWGKEAHFWTTKPYGDRSAVTRTLKSGKASVIRYHEFKPKGMSVRCVQDE